MKTFSYISFIILGMVFTACTNELAEFTSVDELEKVRILTVSSGSIVDPEKEFSIRISSEDLQQISFSQLHAVLEDASGAVVKQFEYTKNEIQKSQNIFLGPIKSGPYIFKVFFVNKVEKILAEERQVFVTTKDFSLKSITVYPNIVSLNANAIAVADIVAAEEHKPYIRWSLDGEVLSEHYLKDAVAGLDKIMLDGMGKQGVYEVKAELFPWGPAEGVQLKNGSSVVQSSDLFVRVQAAEKMNKQELFGYGLDGHLHARNGETAHIDKDVQLDVQDGIVGFHVHTKGALTVPYSIIPRYAGAVDTHIRFLPLGIADEIILRSKNKDGSIRIELHRVVAEKTESTTQTENTAAKNADTVSAPAPAPAKTIQRVSSETTAPASTSEPQQAFAVRLTLNNTVYEKRTVFESNIKRLHNIVLRVSRTEKDITLTLTHHHNSDAMVVLTALLPAGGNIEKKHIENIQSKKALLEDGELVFGTVNTAEKNAVSFTAAPNNSTQKPVITDGMLVDDIRAYADKTLLLQMQARNSVSRLLARSKEDINTHVFVLQHVLPRTKIKLHTGTQLLLMFANDEQGFFIGTQDAVLQELFVSTQAENTNIKIEEKKQREIRKTDAVSIQISRMYQLFSITRTADALVIEALNSASLSKYPIADFVYSDKELYLWFSSDGFLDNTVTGIGVNLFSVDDS